MKNLIRIFLILLIVGGAISIHSSCSDENDCSLAGRPMMYCTFKSIDKTLVPNVIANDTLDSLTITALGTDSIILNNEKKVHKVMLPLRYTSDSTIFILGMTLYVIGITQTLYTLCNKHSLFPVYGMRIYDETEHHQRQVWE